MLTFSNAHPVYLVAGATDLRKSIDGLAALVQEGYGLNPFSPSLFVFCNRERNKLKLLFWDNNGFWLLSGIPDNSQKPFKSQYSILSLSRWRLQKTNRLGEKGSRPNPS
ncbi:IS66 family insertion sequence element accessory protein TnpB [Paenibacillus alkaliterrae]|uniref:IS66 family insertion sequence element accessory protein TnpB n=1 Tax=Paenibacillus alkaliterrae TaxID=320909 RepID=UPI001F3D3417|nr:IS66 family insertion sequence element accessory protein TnpB [Paenibacillus alkaliterrae]MCF2937176.1 IS66 family insertion sequence element accessory protein TnpB [Paenibacillus alkaliterrae]